MIKLWLDQKIISLTDIYPLLDQDYKRLRNDGFVNLPDVSWCYLLDYKLYNVKIDMCILTQGYKI